MGYLSDEVTNQAQRQQAMNAAMKGRTPEQKQVIKYFYGAGGCLGGKLNDEQYESLVMSKIQGVDFKRKALNKLGLDESQVTEVRPLEFRGYYFNPKKTYSKWSMSMRKWVSSAYQISWIFFSGEQVYIYQYTYHMDEDTKQEKVEEYFYKDITNISASSDTEEFYVPDKVSCNGTATYARKNVETSNVSFVVPGERFNCAMTTATEENEQSVQAMRAKLREKKSQ